MGYILRTAFKSGKFRFGFCTISIILLFVIFYPIFSNTDPMAMTGAMFERPNLIRYLRGELNRVEEVEEVELTEAQQAQAEMLARWGIASDRSRERDVVQLLRILGTDNFGRDIVAQLAAATRTSLLIGVLAGSIATMIGLTMGLISGYMGGMVDNILSSIINVVIVIPNFVILILISISIGTRGFVTTGFIIGITAWPWTARSVRAQVTSLRNRDHVNLSKLSGHSMPRIIFRDILPYIASYVMMAFILQMVAGILAEASLSMLGLGPHNVASLGLMMSWSMTFNALPNGAWWAFLPVVLTIALITYSLNMMNSGLDQIFNPQLRS